MVDNQNLSIPSYTELIEIAIRWIKVGWQEGDVSTLGALHTPDFIFKGIEIMRNDNGFITERWGEWDGIEILNQWGKEIR